MLNEAETGTASLDWFARPQMGVLMAWYAQAAKGTLSAPSLLLPRLEHWL